MAVRGQFGRGSGGVGDGPGEESLGRVRGWGVVLVHGNGAMAVELVRVRGKARAKPKAGMRGRYGGGAVASRGDRSE